MLEFLNGDDKKPTRKNSDREGQIEKALQGIDTKGVG